MTLVLYDASAAPRTRPSWQVFMDPLAPVESIPQGSRCDVMGALEPGRAVAVRVDDTYLIATYPIRSPLRGPRLGP